MTERKHVTVDVNSSGDGVGYISVPQGRIMSLHYVKTDYDDGVDFNIALEATGEALWVEANVTASKSVYPRLGVHDGAGVEVEYADAYPIYEPVFAAHDRLVITVAQGGASKTGEFIAIIN